MMEYKKEGRRCVTCAPRRLLLTDTFAYRNGVGREKADGDTLLHTI